MTSPYSGKLIPSKRELLWLREGKICHWCRKPTRYAKGNAWDTATVDHVMPRCKGGGNDQSNLVSACVLCNRRRSYEDQMGLPEGTLLDRYPLPRVPGSRKAAQLRHAVVFNNSTTGRGQMTQPYKSVFDSDLAWYTRRHRGNEKSFNFDIDEMTSEERQLLEEVEAILFRLATEVRQKTDAKLKQKPGTPLVKG